MYHFQIFYGLEDRDLKEAYLFDEPFYAIVVKILVWEWDTNPCMRFDLQGCPGKRRCRRPLNQWQHSFHLKATLPLAESHATASDRIINAVVVQQMFPVAVVWI